MNSFNFDFRPTYFGPQSLEKFYKSRIKGTIRRELVSKNIEQFVPTPLTESSLEENTRDVLGQIHPSFMGGEYLPDLTESEIEIGRIVLESTTEDVDSIRVTRDEDGYSYRIVDEYGSTFEIPEHLRKTISPLSLGEMVDLINNTSRIFEGVEESEEPGLVKPHVTFMLSEGDEDSEIMSFVRVESEFYPELYDFFEYQKELWINEYRD